MCRSQSSEKKAVLKKGPWSPEEDQKLVAFIQQHGQISWRELPSKAGLERCGRSCRLRWNNYLRPGIKRGKFSLQEERTIIQLDAFLGNSDSNSFAQQNGQRHQESLEHSSKEEAHQNGHRPFHTQTYNPCPPLHRLQLQPHQPHGSMGECPARLRESKLQLGSSSTQQPARLAIQKISAQPTLTPKDKNNTKVHNDMYVLMLTTAADDRYREPRLTMSPPALSFPEKGENLLTYPTTSADCAEILADSEVWRCSTVERRATLEDDDIMVAVEAFMRTCQ